MNDSPALITRRPIAPLLLAAILLAAEFLIIGLVFKHGIDFDCRHNWGDFACGTASKSLASLYCIIAAIGLFAFLRSSLFTALFSKAGHSARPLALNPLGLLLALVPALFLREGSGTAMLYPAFAFWVVGMGLILAGILAWLAPRELWTKFLREAGLSFVVVLVAAALAPALAVKIQPIWKIDAIADWTFRSVSWLIEILGYLVFSDPVRKLIGSDDFVISVAPVCSGVEGIALVSIFVSIYLWLFRADLKFPRALLLYPIGIAASVILNVVRITLLLILGIEGHPDLAVGGFHSHAGWMMFIFVALGIIAVAHLTPWLHRDSRIKTAEALPPLRQDPVTARILPFAVFMLTAVIVPVVSQNPAMLYPLRVIILAGAVLLVWPALRSLSRRVSIWSWLAGAAVGLIWALIPVAPSDAPLPYGSLTGGWVLLWFIFRGIGTVLLVPLVEELFFRDYLESRIRGADIDAAAPVWRSLVAAMITAGLFAALHDRWIEAFIAGLIFSLVARMNGRISDAIAAHGIANLIVFIFAIVMGNLQII